MAVSPSRREERETCGEEKDAQARSVSLTPRTGSQRWGAGQDDAKGEEEEEGPAAAAAPRVPAAIALSVSGERGREKAKRTEG